MKKKEKEQAIKKKRTPRGSERGKKSERKKEVAEPRKTVEKEESGVKPTKVIKKDVTTPDGEVKRTEPTQEIDEGSERGKPRKTESRKKTEKKIEKIQFPPSEGEEQKKPKFRRQDSHLLKRVGDRWRKPKGIDSKRRLGKKGKGKVPGIGYKKPEADRYLVKGLSSKHVHNPTQLENVSKNEGIIISSTVGRKKRNDIIREANKLKIIILNPRKGEL